MKCKQCKREIAEGSTYCNWCGKKQVSDRGRGEISVPEPRQLSSGKWFIQLRIGGQSVSITEDTPERCRTQARAIKTGMVEVKRKPDEITLTQAVEEYIEARKGIVSPSTIASYKKIQRLRFQSLMPLKLSAITAPKLQKAVQDESKAGHSAKTVKDAYCFVKTVLIGRHVDLDYDHIALPLVQPSPYKTLTTDQVGVLLKAIRDTPCEVQILLAVWLGLRRSEIIALEKKDFNIDQKSVTISTAIVRNEKNEYVEKGTKCAASARTVSCPDYILEKVKAMPDGKLYTNDPGYILKELHRICDANGLPSVRLHDLRHVNASIMLMLNVPDKYAMERGGWAAKQTMQGRYQHTYDEEAQLVDDVVNTFFSGLLTA